MPNRTPAWRDMRSPGIIGRSLPLFAARARSSFETRPRARRAAPMRQELRDERVLVTRLDGQRRKREADRERDVISTRSRRDGAGIRRVRLVDPDGTVGEAGQLGGSGALLERP